ncbi:MAG: LarC family nickel insertion protein, partial [Candidatus Margulisbacteria bacterium]|nr:LarC family nickel insertion protein [Candidatus Margulisiibacteriota bacterium]
MRVAYFDCPSGLAGNMVLGALLDAGLSAKELAGELRKLEIRKSKSETNYKLEILKTKRHGLAGTYFNVKVNPEKQQRGLADILAIVRKSRLSNNVKALSSRIFRRLAEAEAKVHGIPVSKVHFHEVGAVDAIIDIVGTAIGLEKLGIEKVYCSPLPFGKGKIKHAHGILPNPAPATAELLKGVPIYQENVKGELVTPTGAAIITTIASSFWDLPLMRLVNSGYGAGSITY